MSFSSRRFSSGNPVDPLSGSAELPLIPGISSSHFPHQLSSPNQKKSHIFDYKNGMAVLKEGPKSPSPSDTFGNLSFSSPARSPSNSGSLRSPSNTFASSPSSPVPSFVAFDRKVLRFFGYFRETVPESAVETERVRKLILFYYLLDETIHVSEPPQSNSGIPQGAFIKRHRIPKPDGAGHFTHFDLNIGTEAVLYGKAIRLIDCDDWTRNFLESTGHYVPSPEDYPGDSYSSTRQLSDSRSPHKANTPGVQMAAEEKRYLSYSVKGMFTSHSKEEIEASQNFLHRDRQVLTFRGVWDDRAALYGELHWLTLNYFLSDGTFEISEDHMPGRDKFPVFLKRQRLFQASSSTSLETLARTRNAALPAEGPGQAYTDADLRVGVTISVFERPVLLVSVGDEFTRQYLRESGVSDAEMQPIHVEITPTPQEIAAAAAKSAPPPPHNGYGQPEDSMGSVKYLVLKAPKRDVKKQELDRDVIRFSAALDSHHPEDRNRQFIISVYPSSDEISIYELAVKNSGIISGKFLARQRVQKEGGTPEQYLLPADFRLGNVVRILSHSFVIVGMEEHAKTVLAKIGL